MGRCWDGPVRPSVASGDKGDTLLVMSALTGRLSAARPVAAAAAGGCRGADVDDFDADLDRGGVGLTAHCAQLVFGRGGGGWSLST